MGIINIIHSENIPCYCVQKIREEGRQRDLERRRQRDEDIRMRREERYRGHREMELFGVPTPNFKVTLDHKVFDSGITLYIYMYINAKVYVCIYRRLTSKPHISFFG